MLNCSRMMIYVDTERRSSPINNGHLPELTKRDDKKRPKLTNSAQPSCSLLDTPLSLLASRLPCLRSSCSRLRVFFLWLCAIPVAYYYSSMRSFKPPPFCHLHVASYVLACYLPTQCTSHPHHSNAR